MQGDLGPTKSHFYLVTFTCDLWPSRSSQLSSWYTPTPNFISLGAPFPEIWILVQWILVCWQMDRWKEAQRSPSIAHFSAGGFIEGQNFEQWSIPIKMRKVKWLKCWEASPAPKLKLKMWEKGSDIFNFSTATRGYFSNFSALLISMSPLHG